MQTRIFAVIALNLMLACAARAQFTTNNQTVVFDGVTTNWQGVLSVGYSNDDLQIINSGVLLFTNGYSAYIGEAAAAGDNRVLVSGNGSSWVFGAFQQYASFYIGDSGSDNSLVINHGGSVVIGPYTLDNYVYIGYNAGADNNSLIVSGSGSVWNSVGLPGQFYVGAHGSGNSLVVSNDAEAFADPFIGYYPGANNNSVVVTGSGSILHYYYTNTFLNGGEGFIGFYGSGNSQTASDGGVVDCAGSSITIGAYQGSSNNWLAVTGRGSMLTNSSRIFVGMSGSDNSLLISAGGRLDGPGDVGGLEDGNYYGSNNCAIITGPGSVWDCEALSVGVADANSGNSVIVTNGGALISTNVGGNGDIIHGVGNSVCVTGSGSVWNNGNNPLSVGSGSSSAGRDTLTITNGGVVSDGTGYIGRGGYNNKVMVTGSGSLWTNSYELYFGDTGSTNLLFIQDGGSVVAGSGGVSVGLNGTISNRVQINDGSLLINGTLNIAASNSVIFNSGLLTSGSANDMSGRMFVVGDGTNAATYQLSAGTYTFNGGLRIRNHAILTGCGTINGDVIVDAGGAALTDCGGTLDFTGNVTNNGTLQAINGSVLQVDGTLVNNGTIDAINGATNFDGTFINNGTLFTSRSVLIGQESVSGSDVLVQISSVTNHTYQLQYSDSLAPANWTNLGVSQAGTGGILTFTDSGGVTNGSSGFYRVSVTAP